MPLVRCEERSAGVVTVVLNDPDNLNAMSEDMAAEFSQIVRDLKARAGDLRAIVLTGEGRAFSAGGDLAMLEEKQKLSADENRKQMIKFYQSFLSIRTVNIPLIAAINGHAIGAGLCVASACDIRVASEKAKLGFTFVKLGLHPGMGATYFLPRLLGISVATELLLTGRVIDAAYAKEIGLVSKVVPDAALNGEVDGIVSELKGAGPSSVRELLQSLRGDPAELSAALDREANAQARSYASEEFKEGVRAAREKRAAKF